MNQSNRFPMNDTTSSLRSLMSTDSPAVRASTSKYSRRVLDDSRLSRGGQDSTWSRSNLMDFSTLSQANNTTLTTTQQSLLVDNTIVEDTDGELAESSATLSYQFKEGLQKFHKSENLFELAKEFEDICIDHISVFQDLKKKRPTLSTISKDLLPFDIENMLRYERNTWRLARILNEDRLKYEDADAMEESMLVDEGIQSDTEVMQAIFDRNKNLRQMQLIIDWLELNEHNDMQEKEEQNKIEFYSEGIIVSVFQQPLTPLSLGPHYWENSLHLAKNKRNKLHLGKGAERELNTEMDADAPLRNHKPLHDLDKEDETRMLRYIFKHLRAGELFVGKELAQRLGFHWLSAALDGWLLHHDPKYCGENEPSVGNSRRDLWKYVCWQSATMSDVSRYEKAVFGALSGNVIATLPVCPRWSDKLWAYLKASVDVQIEIELRNAVVPKPVTARISGTLSGSGRSSIDLPEEYWTNRKSTGDIFAEVATLMTSVTWSPEEKCHSEIQKYIATADTASILESMLKWIQTEKHQSSYQQMLRFFAHLALFYKHLNLIDDGHFMLFVDIMESYITHLIDGKTIPLIATYVASLPADRQTLSYSKLLAKITDTNERKECLMLAQVAGLDIENITRTVVETTIPVNIRAPESFESTLRNPVTIETTSEDEIIINSLEWLMIRVQYIELLKQGNALMRSFTLASKVDAAKEVMCRLPINLIDGVYRAWKKKTGKSELPPALNQLTREYLCFKAFFEAMDAFNLWVRFYHNSKPIKPIKPTTSKFTDKVAYEHSVKGYENDLQQWKIGLSAQSKVVSEKIILVLAFPDGGWMKDSNESEETTKTSDESPGDSRAAQMKGLRRQFIPQLTSVAQSVLSTSNRIKESIQLADIVANEDHQLFLDFNSEQLKDLLKRFRESSIAGLNDGTDILGYYPTNE